MWKSGLSVSGISGCNSEIGQPAIQYVVRQSRCTGCPCFLLAAKSYTMYMYVLPLDLRADRHGAWVQQVAVWMCFYGNTVSACMYIVYMYYIALDMYVPYIYWHKSESK